MKLYGYSFVSPAAKNPSFRYPIRTPVVERGESKREQCARRQQHMGGAGCGEERPRLSNEDEPELQ